MVIFSVLMLVVIILSQVYCEFSPKHHLPLNPVDSRAHDEDFSTHHEIRDTSAEQTEEQLPEKPPGSFPNLRVCNPFVFFFF